MKFLNHIALVASLACVLATTAVAQSLGDAARENRASKGERPQATKIYTNEDLSQADLKTGPTASDQSEKKQDSTKNDKTPSDNTDNKKDVSKKAAPSPAPQANSDEGAPTAGRRGILLPGARKKKAKDNAKKDSATSGDDQSETARQQEKKSAPKATPEQQTESADVKSPAKSPSKPEPAAKQADKKDTPATDKSAATKSAETQSSPVSTKPALPPAPLPAPLPAPGLEQASVPDGQPPIAMPTSSADNRSHKKGDDERDYSMPPPLAADATFMAGFYEADTRNGHTTRESSPVASVNFDINGYYHHPGFLKFNFKPQGSLGKQSSEAIFPDGRGFAASTTFLGGSVAPLTVSYSQLDRKIVTFGPLDRLAGLDAKTDQDAFTVNWRLRLRRLPELTMNFSRFNDSYEPLENIAPKTDNHARLFTLQAQQKLAGWNLQSDFRVEHANQQLINLFDPTQAPYDYARNDREIRASADRDFSHVFLVNVNGGASDGKSQINNNPYDQSFRYVNGSGVFRPNDRFSLAFRAGVTDNAVAVTLANTLNSTTSGTPSQPTALLPTQAHLTLQTYGAQASYSLTKDLRIDGDVSRETTSTPVLTSLVTPDSSLNSVQAGLGYSHHFSWFKFQSRYATNAGTFEYGATNSRSLGHRANLELTFGSLKSVELTVAGQGSIQDLNGPADMHDQSWGGSVTVSRVFFQNWKVQATANVDKNAYRYALADYNTLGKGGNFSITHPLFDISAMYQLRDGLTVQADPRLQFLSPTQLIQLQGAFPNALIVPTTSSYTTASVAVHPIARLTARATWLTSRQAVAAASHNRYNQWEASAGYQFRSLTLDFGYIHHDQDFGVDFFRRNRVYFRIVRQFKVF